MSKIERKEYQETKILRTVSPIRNIRTSNQNLAQFDSNLDYMLDDLQNSVSRPGSSLGNNTYREKSRSVNTLESARSNSLSRLKVNAANPATDYSSDDAFSYTSPDGRKHVEGYKKESYSHKFTGGSTDIQPEKIRVQNSINQLDSLLDDLQQVKKTSYSDKESYNNIGSSPDLHDGRSKTSSLTSVKRELHYGDSPRSRSRTRTLERNDRENSITRDIEYTTNEGTYGQVRTSSPSSRPSSRNSTLSKQVKVKNVHSYPVEVLETVTPDINPEVLAHLDPSLRPPGNTKVTTTIKTYTYEIPGSGEYPTNVDSSLDTSEKYVYSPNKSQTTPSKSFVYNEIENKTAQNTVVYPKEINYETKLYKESKSDNITNHSYPPYQKPSPPGGQTIIKETVTTRNYQPEIVAPSKETYIYNESTTTRNVNGYPNRPKSPPRKETYIIKETHNDNYRDEYPVRNAPPPTKETYIYKETHNTTTNTTNRPYPDDYPRGNPPKQETYIHKETHNTTNKPITPPYSNGYPGHDNNKIIIRESHTTNNYTTGNRPKTPTEVDSRHSPYGWNEPVNIKYKYKTTSSTTNNYKTGYPPGDEGEPLLPKPFPTDSDPVGPPKKLDELMANIGREPANSPYNAGYTVHERELVQQKKVNALNQQASEAEDLQRKETAARTKNVSGPPVYYPPGHDLFAKKEEEQGGAWRAQGAYAKESAAYKSGAEESSKTKGSSGAAIIPVCLPCCCGLPCTII